MNKWDLVTKEWKERAMKYMNTQVEKALGEVKKVPIYYTSARTGQRIPDLMDEVLNVYEKWNMRVSTGLLNAWLSKIKKVQTLPAHRGTVLKIRFVTQLKSRPPTFVFFVNNAKFIKENYEVYLKNSICSEFGLEGIPVRVIFKDGKYQETKKNFENNNPFKKFRAELLKQRRIGNFSKQKLRLLEKGREKIKGKIES